ncbi:MAG: GWxTD domain-containing protein [candidate division WOR-3 bacterium]|nr:GWxTD domain-containing protein [candidate division WOR-3 bacterium]MCX7837306.1 GWxTD domain-containing protein [candidate division WOR-3 bacterium]
MVFLFSLLIFYQSDLEINYDYNYFYNYDTFYFNLEYKIPYNSVIFFYRDKIYYSSFFIQLIVDSLLIERIDTIFVDNYEEALSNKLKTGQLSFKIFTKSLKKKIKILIKDLNSERMRVEELIIDLNKPTLFINCNQRENARLSIKDSLIFQITPYKMEKEIFYQIINPEERVIKKDTFKNPLKIFLSDFLLFSQSGNYKIEFFNKKIKKGFSFFLDLPFYLSDKDYFKKISYLIYVATPTEMEELKKAERGEREMKWREFWKKKNISEEEYFLKIEYCEKNFGRGDKGAFSDRAKIYFQYGEPDHIENFPYEIDKKPYIKWYYYRYNKEFLFVDLRGFGEYILVSEK